MDTPAHSTPPPPQVAPTPESHQSIVVPPEYYDPKWGSEHLRSLSTFRLFTVEELTRLYAKGKILVIQPGSYAVIESEMTRGLYVVLQGTFSVYKADPGSQALHRLSYLEAGSNFGELSLFDTAPRSASVAAEVQSMVFFLDADIFNEFVRSEGPDLEKRFYRACAEDLVARFRKLNNDYILAQQQLWKYALNIANATHATPPDSNSELPIKQGLEKSA